MRYLTKTTIFFMLCICCQYAFGQKSFLSKEKPTQGEKLIIYYRLMPDAKLIGKDTVFSAIQYWNEQGSYFKKTVALAHTDADRWSAIFEIPKDAAYLSIRFYQLSMDDADATINKMIYNRGIPAMGATYQDFSGTKLHHKFQEEIERYPNNYFAYARYVNSLPSDTVDAILPGLIAKLLAVKNDNDGLLSALTVAYTKQGKKEIAYAKLLQLLEKYPTSFCTDFAFSHFLYEQYKNGGSMLATGNLYEKLKEIFILHPESSIASAYNNIATLSRDKSIPTAAFERVVRYLHHTGRINYNSIGILPNLYLNRNIKLDEAEYLLKQNINMLISGEIYHQDRLPTSYIYTYTTQYLRTLAKVHILQHKASEAILVLSTALQQIKGSNFEGELRPVLEMELAAAFLSAGNYSVALDQYKRMYLAGNEKVKDSIEQLYLKLSDRVELDRFLSSVNKSSTPSDNNKPAALFSGTDLSGNLINLSDYKGKIVVLNAWFIGCVPCIAEMPELNKLVDNYAGQKDIVFLALTPDKTDALSKFLQKTDFKYGIVNNLKGIEAYDITAYPQHIIIDRNGRIVYRTTGAVSGIVEKLSEVIEKQKKLGKTD